ncbi:hypothetical protein V6N13_098971 [Hibiscus sabdariffa]
MVRDVGYRPVMWFAYVVPGEKLEDDTIIAWDDDSFRNMIEHYYESNDDVLKIDYESRVGTRVSGGPVDSVVGEASNVGVGETSNAGGSHELNDIESLFDVNLGDSKDAFEGDSKVAFEGKGKGKGKASFEENGKGEASFEGDTKGEAGFERDEGLGFIFRKKGADVDGETNKGNKGTKSADRDDEFERQQDSDRDDKSGRETDYIDSSDDGEVVCKKSMKLLYDTSDPIPYLQLGLIFESARQFKDALSKFVLTKDFILS